MIKNKPIRIQKLQELLVEKQIDALIIEDSINLFYLTGFTLSAGTLVISQSSANLLVDGRYFEQCSKHPELRTFLSSEVPLKNLFQKVLPELSTIAFSEKTSYKNYRQLQGCIEEILKESPNRQLVSVPTEGLVEQLRLIKDEEEIQLLQRSAVLGSRGYDFVCQNLREGVTEKELANELEIFWKKERADGIAFSPIIAFGSSSSMPHYHVGDKQLKRGENVLIDIGVTMNHYHSDMTRVQFYGDPDPKMQEIYAVVKEAQQAALTICRAGISIAELDNAARKVIHDKGYGSYFPHSLGHGIGLEVHESPILRNSPPFNQMVLLPGMVITIEPGIYLPGLGGVRLEDTILITPNGYENLTCRKIF